MMGMGWNGMGRKGCYRQVVGSMQACAAKRKISAMLNQLQHRLNCLIISVMTVQIQDSLAFTVFFRSMPRDLLRSCLYVGAQLTGKQSTAEISSSRGNTVRAEQSCLGLKGNTYGEIKSHLASISHNIHAHLRRAWLARVSLKMMKSPLYALRYSTLFFFS